MTETIVKCKKMKKTKSNNKGQFFTTNEKLKEKVYSFIQNTTTTTTNEILEPSIGQGDLVAYLFDKLPRNTLFDMYEIDNTIPLLPFFETNSLTNYVVYTDFMTQTITKQYTTIVGNPPYIRTKKGNLYIDFTEKCYRLLADNGELIFIVPCDFLKLTSASTLLQEMMNNGTFTHIWHPNDEQLFDNAFIDIIVFRYCKNTNLQKKVLYNDVEKQIVNTNGLITFITEQNDNTMKVFSDYFDIYVGLVTAKEEAFKNDELGNISVLNGENVVNKYIFVESFPTENPEINEHLMHWKPELLKRGIRKFSETNWFEWGGPRNISTMRKYEGTDCIYVSNLSRKANIAFLGKVQYFGGGLLMLLPKKKEIDLQKVVSYLHSNAFRENFTYANRFKIGHRQISNSLFPDSCIIMTEY